MRLILGIEVKDASIDNQRNLNRKKKVFSFRVILILSDDLLHLLKCKWFKMMHQKKF
jgi:hypothetical protein